MLPKKILLVDDSATALMMTKMVLRNLGSIHVLTASDGAEGVEKALECRPDLILMDLNMPGMDGLAATRQLRKHPETRNLPIFMLTTRSEPKYVREGFRAGCDDYLTKPVNVQEFLAKLRKVLLPSSRPVPARSQPSPKLVTTNA